MFIAGSYMLYSSTTPNFSSVVGPCSSPVAATCTPPPHFSAVSAFTTTSPSSVQQQQQHQNRSLEPADLSHLKKVTGFSVTDILDKSGSNQDLVDEVEKSKTPSNSSLKRKRFRGGSGVGSFSSMSSISPSSSSSSSSSHSETSSPPLSLPPSPPTFSPHSSSVDIPQDLSSAIPVSKLSPIRDHHHPPYSSQSSHFSYQLKFGVDRILSNDLRKDVASSCTMCVSPFSPPLAPHHHLPPLPLSQPLPQPTPTSIRCRTSGVPCECMHPLCDGTGLFPTLYTYSSLPFPACAIYPPTHISSEREPSRGVGGGPPHLHQQNSYHNHHHHQSGPNPVSGKRKRSWSRAVFSNLQRKGLEKRFQIQKYITKPDRRQLAATLGLTDAQVKVWFQNRRMKWRHSKEAKEEFAKQVTTKVAEEQQNNKNINNNNEIQKGTTTESKNPPNARTKSVD